MKLKIKEKIDMTPKIGEIRVIKRFAIFPIRIGKVKVWLEFYYKEQVYTEGAGRCLYRGTMVRTYDNAWVTKRIYQVDKNGTK